MVRSAAVRDWNWTETVPGDAASNVYEQPEHLGRRLNASCCQAIQNLQILLFITAEETAYPHSTRWCHPTDDWTSQHCIFTSIIAVVLSCVSFKVLCQ